MKNFTTEELIIFERLIIANRDSASLQRKSECSYLDSIRILNKIRDILGRNDNDKNGEIPDSSSRRI